MLNARSESAREVEQLPLFASYEHQSRRSVSVLCGHCGSDLSFFRLLCPKACTL